METFRFSQDLVLLSSDVYIDGWNPKDIALADSGEVYVTGSQAGAGGTDFLRRQI